eukprot:SAG22_NODE_8_length_37215_cov_120.960351_20_plen_455_part_00
MAVSWRDAAATTKKCAHGAAPPCPRRGRYRRGQAQAPARSRGLQQACGHCQLVGRSCRPVDATPRCCRTTPPHWPHSAPQQRASSRAQRHGGGWATTSARCGGARWRAPSAWRCSRRCTWVLPTGSPRPRAAGHRTGQLQPASRPVARGKRKATVVAAHFSAGSLQSAERAPHDAEHDMPATLGSRPALCLGDVAVRAAGSASKHGNVMGGQLSYARRRSGGATVGAPASRHVGRATGRHAWRAERRELAGRWRHAEHRDAERVRVGSATTCRPGTFSGSSKKLKLVVWFYRICPGQAITFAKTLGSEFRCRSNSVGLSTDADIEVHIPVNPQEMFTAAVGYTGIGRNAALARVLLDREAMWSTSLRFDIGLRAVMLAMTRGVEIPGFEGQRHRGLWPTSHGGRFAGDAMVECQDVMSRLSQSVDGTISPQFLADTELEFLPPPLPVAGSGWHR